MDVNLALTLRNSLKGNVERKVALFSEIIYEECFGKFGQFGKRKEVMPKAKSVKRKGNSGACKRTKSTRQGLEKGEGTSERRLKSPMEQHQEQPNITQEG